MLPCFPLLPEPQCRGPADNGRDCVSGGADLMDSGSKGFDSHEGMWHNSGWQVLSLLNFTMNCRGLHTCPSASCYAEPLGCTAAGSQLLAALQSRAMCMCRCAACHGQVLGKLRRKLEQMRELRDLVRSLGRSGGKGPKRMAPQRVSALLHQSCLRTYFGQRGFSWPGPPLCTGSASLRGREPWQVCNLLARQNCGHAAKMRHGVPAEAHAAAAPRPQAWPATLTGAEFNAPA